MVFHRFRYITNKRKINKFFFFLNRMSVFILHVCKVAHLWKYSHFLSLHLDFGTFSHKIKILENAKIFNVLNGWLKKYFELLWIKEILSKKSMQSFKRHTLCLTCKYCIPTSTSHVIDRLTSVALGSLQHSWCLASAYLPTWPPQPK